MILFKNDWLKFPSAIIDYKTTNTSALELAALYKRMGIDNHAFILALHDPSLQGINPHDPKLSSELKAAIVIECRDNPWYFFREVAMLPASSGVDPIRFQLNRGNISLFWLFYNHVSTLLIQPRQTGKSASTDVLMTHLMGVGTTNANFNLLTKDDSLRVANVTRLKEIYQELPEYLQLKTRGDTNNTEKITINALGNTYTTSVAQSSPKAALNLGRGMTIAINHIDEPAFIKNIDVTLPALLASGGASRDNAAAAGEPYGNIFTTTAGYLNSKEGKYVYDEMYNASMRWTEKLFDAGNEEELYKVIKKNSPGKKVMVLCEFNHRQLGKTDEWLRGKINDAMAKGDAVLADFLNIWVEGSESSPIPKKLLKLIKDSVVNEPYIEINKGYITKWYVTEQEIVNKVISRETVLTLDTSDMVNNDDTALTLRDVRTGATLAAGVYNETNIIEFSEWIAAWIERFPKLTVIIERRSSGVAIIDNLLKILPVMGIDPFARVFNWVVDEAVEYPKRAEETIMVPMKRRDPSVYVKYRKYFGYGTSGSGKSSRDNLYGDALMQSIKYTGKYARDKILVNQISGLTMRNGRIDHGTGKGDHDDMVISWMLGYWFLTKARNIVHYGIPENASLSVVINEDLTNDGTVDKLARQEEQIAVKEVITTMIEMLRSETNPVKEMMLTNRIKHLNKDIDVTISSPLNLESVLDQIKEEKRVKYRR